MTEITNTASAARKIGFSTAKLPVQVNGSIFLSLPSSDTNAWVQEDVADVRYQLRNQNNEDGNNRASEQ